MKQRHPLFFVVHSDTVVETFGELAVVIFASAVATDDVRIGLDSGEGAASITVSVESAKRVIRALATATVAATDVPQGIPPKAG